ncbi:hypothetical protein [Jeotgalibacillus campisalis]|uniref:Uncharacterized protein n=1 Tax=Jeotgalibacillus campisalis TaxID=220754 RepID=A0A0C2VTX1_9BACL|nr:hypothetical protein [Jeotgalibacillus campisalis]KIL47871.1 hypothetical protein KR50_20380 [Jeotgalibacillus campisalis]
MGMKRYALLGLGAAGYAYFKNKTNRDKATVAFNDTKVKINQLIDQAKQSMNDNEGQAPKATGSYDLEDEKMMEEGAQTSVHYFNENQEESKKQTNQF